jgi:hypothetical protein
MSKVKTMNTVKTTKSNTKKGRPVDPNSARQKELKLKAELRKLGLIKRGRPVNKESNRQKEIERKAELRELGVLNGKKGRPINQNSKRQQRMALRAAGKIRKPGRPKMVKQDQNDK